MYKSIFYVLFLFAGALHYAAANEKFVLCYYGTWATYRSGLGKFDVSDINTELCTHIVYTFFGINARGTVISLDPYLDYPDNWGKDMLRKFNALKNYNPNLKTLLAVGGFNQGSEKYSVMAANEKLRRNFITSAVEILKKFDFDGLDVDWEYPNRGDSVHGNDDIKNFNQLLKELRQEFDKHGLILSAAVSSVKDMASLSYDIPAIIQYLDFINVMAYDLSTPIDLVTGHNSPLHKGEGDENKPKENAYTIEAILDYWLAQGCPPNKLVLGLPLYGHTYELMNAKENGVRAASLGPGIAGPHTATRGFIGYNEMCQKLRAESWELRYDDLAKVPYAVQGRNWVSYDDANSLTLKVKYAVKRNITGIMTWSIDTDDFLGLCQSEDFPLLRAVNAALGRSVTNPSIPSPNPTTLDPSKFICEDVGYFGNPSSCSSYYYCMRSANGDIVPKLLHCPPDLHWDQKNQSCSYPNLANCKI